MSRFNKQGTKTAPRTTRATAPIRSVSTTPDTRTHEGAAGYLRDGCSELFLTVTSGMITEDAFYETSDERVARVRELTRTISIQDGGFEWLTDFVHWLRREGNMRSAPIVLAAEAVQVRLSGNPFVPEVAEGYTNRRMVGAALDRADEPGEFLAYWLATFGKPLPAPVKRGLGDAANRLYSPYSLLKYDTSKAALRFGDVVSLVRPKPKDFGTEEVFQHVIERRHPSWEDKRGTVPQMVKNRAALERVPVAERRAMARALVPHGGLTETLRGAGATWEWLSGWLADGKGMDAEAWGWVIPQMGYMALLRNLANFDRAGVPDDVADLVIARLVAPDQIARSRQFPFRFLSAYKAAPSDRWKYPISRALDVAVGNIPALPGRSLVLIDTSGSMGASMSAKSAMPMVEAAALFGIATARRMQAVDIYGFATGLFGFQQRKGASTLAEVDKFRDLVGSVGHGTMIDEAIRRSFAGHDRVFLFSDMQTADYVRSLPGSVPLYAFNLHAYAPAAVPSGKDNRFELGGLTDSTFRMISNIERGKSGQWPWQE